MAAALAAALPAAARGEDPAAEPEAPGPWTVAGSFGAAGHPGGAGTFQQLLVRYAAWPSVHLEVAGRSGHVGPFGPDDQVYGALALGAGWTTGASQTRHAFRLGARVAHIHHATVSSWRATPIANLLGDSHGGVEHRNGFELVAGFTGAPVGRMGRWTMLWEADGVVGMLPSSTPMRWTAGLMLSFALRSPG
jgi:hypothetical protein